MRQARKRLLKSGLVTMAFIGPPYLYFFVDSPPPEELICSPPPFDVPREANGLYLIVIAAEDSY